MNTTERVEFAGAGGQTIAGRLELPADMPRALAIFAHCFTCSKDLKAVVRISRALAGRGIGVLRFDFTGLGESEGVFAETDFRSNVGDLVAAADYLRARLEGPQLLIGHSLGGAAVLAAAAAIEESRAVVTIGAPSDTDHLRKQLLASEPDLEATDSVEVELGGRPVRIGRKLVEDLGRQDVESAIGALGRPLLILHSPVDGTVGIDHAARIYEAARHPKSFVSLDGADHLLLERDGDSRFVAEIIAAWASRYLVGDRDLAVVEAALESGEGDARHDGVGQGEVVTSSRGASFTHDIRSEHHRWLADEPASAGGDDLGPSPYELLLSALAACKAMTLRMYADRKGWPLQAVRVRARHSRIHAEDCVDCVTEKGLVDRIDVELEVFGSLDADQRDRLHEIADRCPVHRTLQSETRIETALVR